MLWNRQNDRDFHFRVQPPITARKHTHLKREWLFTTWLVPPLKDFKWFCPYLRQLGINLASDRNRVVRSPTSRLEWMHYFRETDDIPSVTSSEVNNLLTIISWGTVSHLDSCWLTFAIYASLTLICRLPSLYASLTHVLPIDMWNNIPHYPQTEINGRGPCEPSLTTL